jgi:hypothetical protein
MLHPFITAELVRQRRADLRTDADCWRRVRLIRRQPGANVPIPISRFRTTARGVHGSARFRLGAVAHGSAGPKGQ